MSKKYQDGDFINHRGQRWVIEEDNETSTWWASNSDGEEIEFILGTEDHHDSFKGENDEN